MEWPSSDDGVLRIDCAECVMHATSACDDCLVTYLCRDASRPAAVVIDVAEVRALRMLQRGGLAPALRHRPRSSAS